MAAAIRAAANFICRHEAEQCLSACPTTRNASPSGGGLFISAMSEGVMWRWRHQWGTGDGVMVTAFRSNAASGRAVRDAAAQDVSVRASATIVSNRLRRVAFSAPWQSFHGRPINAITKV